MNTIESLRHSLETAGLSAAVLAVPGAGRAVVAPGLGAKVLAAGVDEENAFWVPETVTPGQWCVGGQRTWLAPELGPRGFFGKDETDWSVDPALDPGRWEPAPARAASTGSGGGVLAAYRAEMQLERGDGASVRLALLREITLSGSPEPAPLPALCLRVRHTLVNRGERPLEREAGLWSVLQVPAERDGTMLLSLRRGSELAEPRLYFGHLPSGWLRRGRGLLYVRARSGQRFKLGLSPACASGTMAFLRPSRLDRYWTLIVQRCAVEPLAVYLDGPPGGRNAGGDSQQCYNHSDPRLPFAELECHAPARALQPGGRQSATTDYRIVKGPLEDLLEAAHSWLGRAVVPELLFR